MTVSPHTKRLCDSQSSLRSSPRIIRPPNSTMIAGAGLDNTRFFRSRLEASTLSKKELRIICVNDDRLRPLLSSEDPVFALGLSSRGSSPPPHRHPTSMTKEQLIDGMLQAGWQP
mmetsp:Transcript_520/g.1701  ORF Transcript_520/g.1701 Transcript_520/m.1701 type:complete len:115 (-) Transcript_520:50-394(-)|eukprot:scaffold20814_cov36-Tisochrysis_lutea.AAC.1